MMTIEIDITVDRPSCGNHHAPPNDKAQQQRGLLKL
jgi:hypothetical protein